MDFIHICMTGGWCARWGHPLLSAALYMTQIEILSPPALQYVVVKLVK